MNKNMNKDMNEVLDEIERVTDFDARLYRKSTLKRRLDFRVHVTGSKDYKGYLRYLKKDRDEYWRFLEALTINVTDFFRDKSVFETLKRKILPDILKRIQKKGRKRVRILSVGCSAGQEPYSLAILLQEILGERRETQDGFQIIIHAMDLNSSSLKKASAAWYSESEMKNVPGKYLRKFFEKGDKGYRVRKDVRKMVKFHQQDFIKGDRNGLFDLILCRNLFIFFEHELQKSLCRKIHSSLKKDGILVMGKAETPYDETLFLPISTQDRIYMKK